MVYLFLSTRPLSTLKLTFLLGVNTSSTVASIALPMRVSRVVLLPIQSSKLDSLCCRSMGITLRTTASKQGISDQERKIYLKTTQVHCFTILSFTLILVAVVPNRILWKRGSRRCQWSFLPCIQYSRFIQHPKIYTDET